MKHTLKCLALSLFVMMLSFAAANASASDAKPVEAPAGLHWIADGEASVPGCYVSTQATDNPATDNQVADAAQETDIAPLSVILFETPSFLPIETQARCGRPGDDCLFVGNAGCCSGICELLGDSPPTAICH